MIAAGKALGVSQSTIHRRLVELETRMGRKLVSRHPEGYRLTDYGTSLLPFAQRIGAACADLERHIREKQADLTGVVRVTCPEPIVQLLQQSRLMEKFHAAHPGLSVQFVTSDRYLDLRKGEADIAFRSGDTDEELIGRKVAESVWSIFASADYVRIHGTPATVTDLAQHALVVFDKAHVPHRSVDWFLQVAPGAKIASSHNSVLGLISGVKSGVGVGALPKLMGDREPDLVCVLDGIPALNRAWRILTHPDLRHIPRIAAFFEFMVENREELRGVIGS